MFGSVSSREAEDGFFAADPFTFLSGDEEASVYKDGVGELVGIIGAVLEDQAPAGTAGQVDFGAVEHEAVVDTDAAGFGGDGEEGFRIFPEMGFLACALEDAVDGVVEQAEFVAALDHLHAAVFGGGVVEHDHHGGNFWPLRGRRDAWR